MTLYNGHIFKQTLEAPTSPALPHLPGAFGGIGVAELSPPNLNGALAPPPVPVPDPGDGLHILLMEPESPWVETLMFKTSVLEHLDGTEQRIAFRQRPQIMYQYKVVGIDNCDNQLIDNMFYGTQADAMFIPLWFQPTTLATDIPLDTFDVELTNIEDREITEGHYYMVYESDENYSIFIADSINPTTRVITNTSYARRTHPAGTKVFPMKKVHAPADSASGRYKKNVRTYDVILTDVDTTMDLASLTGWPTYDGSLLFSEYNGISGETMNSSYHNAITVLDSDVGIPEYKSDFLASKRISSKQFKANGQEARWTLRQLIYAMRGRQVSFYLPSFCSDLTPVLNLSSSSDLLRIANCGYTQFVWPAAGHRIVRVVKTDGTTIVRTITAAAEDVSGVENLTVDTNWPTDVNLSEIDRVEFLEKVRFNSDTFNLTYMSDGAMYVNLPVITVY